MTAGRFLFFLFLTAACFLPAHAFQVLSPSRMPSSVSADPKSNQDELDLHRSAAESYQLSGDVTHAELENRLIVSLALIRLAAIAIRESQPDRGAEMLRESIIVNDNLQARTALASIYLQ